MPSRYPYGAGVLVQREVPIARFGFGTGRSIGFRTDVHSFLWLYCLLVLVFILSFQPPCQICGEGRTVYTSTLHVM